VSDYLGEGSVLGGGRIIAGSPGVFDQLVTVLGEAL
jgi:hypothetical protein